MTRKKNLSKKNAILLLNSTNANLFLDSEYFKEKTTDMYLKKKVKEFEKIQDCQIIINSLLGKKGRSMRHDKKQLFHHIRQTPFLLVMFLFPVDYHDKLSITSLKISCEQLCYPLLFNYKPIIEEE